MRKKTASDFAGGAGDAVVTGLFWGLAEHGLPHAETHLAARQIYAQIGGALVTTAKGAMLALSHLEQRL